MRPRNLSRRRLWAKRGTFGRLVLRIRGKWLREAFALHSIVRAARPTLH